MIASAITAQPPASSLQPPASSLQPPASSLQPPASSLQPPASSLQPSAPFIMFPTWRLKIREARMALDAGRPEEAGQILQQESVRDFLPAKKLSHQVAQQLVTRAEQLLLQGDSVAGWSDLQQAACLGGCDGRVAQLQAAQAQLGIERVRSYLIQGETKLATKQIARLEHRRLAGNQRQAWRRIVQLISRAQELSAQGKATGAAEMFARATRLLPDPQDELAAMFTQRQTHLKQQADDLRSLSGKLHRAITEAAWSEVLTTAEAVLELAPDHTAAREARCRAWKVVGLQATQVRPTSPKRNDDRHSRRFLRSLQSTRAWTSSAKVDTKAMHKKTGKRVIAWIDGVGGYLICLGEEVMLGQPAGSGGAEIPILADLSRRHASIRREGEAYVIVPIHSVRVDGFELTGPLVLKDGALLELGAAVRLRFRKPHALSSTAILTLESHHKTEPAVDGIVLMSESCVLGSKPQSHIRCRDWTEDLVLFRRGDDLHFRTAACISVDGVDVDRAATADRSQERTLGGGVITDNTRIDGESFSLSFEAV